MRWSWPRATPARPWPGRRGAGIIVVERSDAGRLDRFLRSPDLARALLDRTTCTIIAVGGSKQSR